MANKKLILKKYHLQRCCLIHKKWQLSTIKYILWYYTCKVVELTHQESVVIKNKWNMPAYRKKYYKSIHIFLRTIDFYNGLVL